MVVMRMELQEPLPSEAGHLPLTGKAGVHGGESVDHALDLARSLAERLASLTHPFGAADSIGLARALALNVVDLLEEHTLR